MGQYNLQQYVDDLRRIAAETTNESDLFDQLGPLALRLAREGDILKPQHLSAATATEPGLDLLHEEEDHSLAVMLVSWPAKFGVNPHDHNTWAVVAGVRGQEHNTTYARTDDGSVPDHAELSVKAEGSLNSGDLVCMKTGGIHSVRNDGDEVAVSLHTYGRHVNYTDRVQFDLETGAVRPFKV